MSGVGGQPKKNTQISVVKQQNKSNALFLSLTITSMIIMRSLSFKFLIHLRGYLHETGTNSDRHEFVSTSIHFFLCAYMRPA